MHPPSEVKGPCSGAEPRAGRSCFPMCCSEQSSDLSLSFHLIFIAALLNFVSKYKVTVAPRNRARAYFWILTTWCSIPLWDVPCPWWGRHLEKWNSHFSSFWAALSFQWHLVIVKAVGTWCSLEFQHEKWNILALPESLEMAEKCSVPAMADLIFSQFYINFICLLKNGCCTASFRCVDIEHAEYSSKGLKCPLRALWMPCPHHTEVVHNSSCSTSESLEPREGNSWQEAGKCLPLPLCFVKGAAGMETVLGKPLCL